MVNGFRRGAPDERHNRMRTARLLSLVVSALVVVIGLAIGAMPGGAQTQPVPAVIVAPVQISDLRPARTYSGRAVSVQKGDVRAQVEGIVRSIKFKEGLAVKAGDVLYRIDERLYQAAVDEIEASLAGAEAARRLAQLDRDRKAKLAERDTVSQAQLDVAVAKLAQAESEVAHFQARLTRAKLELSFCTIVASFDGVPGISAVDVGALVGPGSGALTTLTSTDPMGVEFPLSSAELVELRETRLREGGPRARADTVKLTLANGSAYETQGRIDFVGVRVSQSTDTSIVRAEFANPDQLLLHGALVGVTLVQSEPELVINVPQRAVQRDQLGPFVMVADAQGSVEQRRVVVERVTSGRSVITKGLREGELVITEGLTKVRPGITVNAKVQKAN